MGEEDAPTKEESALVLNDRLSCASRKEGGLTHWWKVQCENRGLLLLVKVQIRADLREREARRFM